MAIFYTADAVVTHFLDKFIHQNSPICRLDYIIIFWTVEVLLILNYSTYNNQHTLIWLQITN